MLASSLPQVQVSKVKEWAREAEETGDFDKLLAKVAAAGIIRHVVTGTKPLGDVNGLAQQFTDGGYHASIEVLFATFPSGKSPRSVPGQFWYVLHNDMKDTSFRRKKSYNFLAVLLSEDASALVQELPEEVPAP